MAKFYHKIRELVLTVTKHTRDCSEVRAADRKTNVSWVMRHHPEMCVMRGNYSLGLESLFLQVGGGLCLFEKTPGSLQAGQSQPAASSQQPADTNM